jgi:uncharacterized protein
VGTCPDQEGRSSMASKVEEFLDALRRWALGREDVLAMALVGSQARGTARPESDVDLVILAADPAVYRADDAWVSSFGLAERVQDEDWGLVMSKRVRYGGGLEVESGIASARWAKTDPADAGTARVVRDGFRILHDPAGLLHTLRTAILR